MKFKFRHFGYLVIAAALCLAAVFFMKRSQPVATHSSNQQLVIPSFERDTHEELDQIFKQASDRMVKQMTKQAQKHIAKAVDQIVDDLTAREPEHTIGRILDALMPMKEAIQKTDWGSDETSYMLEQSKSTDPNDRMKFVNWVSAKCNTSGQ